MNEGHAGMARDLEQDIGSKMQEGLFGPSEQSNWVWSRAYGIGEEIAQSNAYANLRAKGLSRDKAVYELLSKDPELTKRAMHRGEKLAVETQFGSSPANMPAWMTNRRDSAVGRATTMFMRYGLALPEMLVRSMGSDAKAYAILQRGLSEEASIADKFLATKQALKQFPKMIKEAPVGANKDLYVIQSALLEDLSNYKKFINKIEPGMLRTKTGLAMAANVLGAATIRYLWKAAGNQLDAMLELPQDKPVGLMSLIAKNTPGYQYATAGGAMNQPFQVDTQHGMKRAAKTAIDLGVKFLPVLRAADVMFPGHVVSKGAERLMGVSSKR